MHNGSDLLKALGFCISKHRRAMFLSQEQLAVRAQVDPKYLSEVERGERNISVRNLQQIAESLGISTASLMKEVNARLQIDLHSL